MMRIGAVVLTTACALAAGTALAQPQPPGSEDKRYVFQQVPDGFVRLDVHTGHVSLCSKQTAGWACLAVPDDRAALENEIGRLQTENATLKREILARGLALPGGLKAESPGAASPKGNDQGLKLPSDADLDRAMTFLEKAWRRLVEMIASLQKDTQNKI